MSQAEDPRLTATRNHALDAALTILQEQGVLAVTHGSVSAATGISRSTLYRHWPKLEALRNDAFLLAATSPKFTPRTNGPLRTDLLWMMGNLMTALNETPWGAVAPQVIAVAATDARARTVIESFMKDRMTTLESVFAAARDRGELSDAAPVRQLVEMAIAVPYFRKLIAGLPLTPEWLDAHVDMICGLATAAPPD
ncbi:TetR/AcrR family transcriptional regulator [Antarctobacter jejuensis]|uniref:TetR/AcrR family transcriptional regulator n=1 Tax=Antarctobacter jejuensis TaxID=1439938 RepID=UPI003FCF1513